MNILILLAHPNKGSFNHAIADTTLASLSEQGHEVVFRDLYAEGFDPLITVQEISPMGSVPEQIDRNCQEIVDADGIVVIHPNWWGQPPAILKGWVDRVLRPGMAYRFDEGDDGEGIPVGLLKAESVLVLNTSNTPQYREQNVFGDPLENLWKTCIFDFCGVTNFHRRMFNVVITSTGEQRQQWLEEVRELCRTVFSG